MHFYDEPGLTWEKGTPHAVSGPAAGLQERVRRRSHFPYTEVKPGDPDAAARWQQWGRWKTSFLEAAWKDARFAVEQVRPDLVSATQSQYAWNAYADGYYFNAARSLPVLSGHGGYDDGPGSYFYPPTTTSSAACGSSTSRTGTCPTGATPARDELYRLEQYLCFMNNLQGLAKSPDPVMNNPYSRGLVAQRGGNEQAGPTVGDHLQYRTGHPVLSGRGEVAMLYPLSQCLDAQIRSGMNDNYLGGGLTRGRLLSLYFAGKMIRIPMTPIVEEDVLDGSLAADYKAVVLTNVNYLAPKVVAVLEDYAAQGGLVLTTDDCQAPIKGAKGLAPRHSDLTGEIERVWAAGRHEEIDADAGRRPLLSGQPPAGRRVAGEAGRGRHPAHRRVRQRRSGVLAAGPGRYRVRLCRERQLGRKGRARCSRSSRRRPLWPSRPTADRSTMPSAAAP